MSQEMEPQDQENSQISDWQDYYSYYRECFDTLGKIKLKWLCQERFRHVVNEGIISVPRTIVGIGEGDDPVAFHIAIPLCQNNQPLDIKLYDPAYNSNEIRMIASRKALEVFDPQRAIKAQILIDSKYPQKDDLERKFINFGGSTFLETVLPMLKPATKQQEKFWNDAYDVYKTHLPAHIKVEFSSKGLPDFLFPDTEHIVCFSSLANYLNPQLLKGLFTQPKAKFVACSNGIKNRTKSVNAHPRAIKSSLELLELGIQNGFLALDLMLSSESMEEFIEAEKGWEAFPEMATIMMRPQTDLESEWIAQNTKVWNFNQ